MAVASKACKRARCKRAVYARGLCRTHWAEDRQGQPAAEGEKPAPKPQSVSAAVASELRVLEEKKPGVTERPLASLAVALAKMVEDKDATVSARASASRELRATMIDLERELAADGEGDEVDALQKGIRDKLPVAAA